MERRLRVIIECIECGERVDFSANDAIRETNGQVNPFGPVKFFATCEHCAEKTRAERDIRSQDLHAGIHAAETPKWADKDMTFDYVAINGRIYKIS